MAHGVPGFMRIGAVIAGCALVAACNPDPGPTISPSPTPVVSSTSATPSASPTETDIERQQRLDWEAAEKAYRTAIAESDRIAQNGGASKPTQLLASVATGKYLDAQVGSLKYLKSRGWRVKGSIKIVGVRRVGGWSARQLQLLTCEDNSTWRMLDAKGTDVTPAGDEDYIQSLTVTKVDNKWKVSALRTDEIPEVSSKDCAP